MKKIIIYLACNMIIVGSSLLGMERLQREIGQRLTAQCAPYTNDLGAWCVCMAHQRAKFDTLKKCEDGEHHACSRLAESLAINPSQEATEQL